MTYGPLSSAANVGTSLLSSFAGPEISKYLIEQGFNPAVAKALAVAGPAGIAGGIGAATSGDKYGMINALPAGIMSYLSMPSGGSKGGEEAHMAPQATPIPDSTKQTLADNDVLGTFLNGKPKSSISNIATQSSPTPEATQQALASGDPMRDYMPKKDTTLAAAPDTAKAPTEGAKGGEDMGGIFGKLMSTPEGKMMVAMLLSNTFSSLGTTAGTDAYYNNLNRQTGQADALIKNQQRRNINRAFGYAMGGPVAPTVVRNPQHLHPQAMIPKADPHMGASQVRREVVTPPAQFKHGELVGPGDGMSDSIEANIDGKRKAKVATGEYVVPREAAEKYGSKLNKMMKAVRAAAHPKKGEQVKQDAAKREFIRQMSGIKA